MKSYDICALGEILTLIAHASQFISLIIGAMQVRNTCHLFIFQLLLEGKLQPTSLTII